MGSISGNVQRVDCSVRREITLPPADMWATLWTAYRSVAHIHVGHGPPGSPYTIPYRIGFVEGGKGRAVIAAADIPKGQLYYNGDTNDVVFSESEYRNFLKAIPGDRYCDVLGWTYCDSEG